MLLTSAGSSRYRRIGGVAVITLGIAGRNLLTWLSGLYADVDAAAGNVS